MTLVGARSERAGRSCWRCSRQREVRASSVRLAVVLSPCKLQAARPSHHA